MPNILQQNKNVVRKRTYSSDLFGTDIEKALLAVLELEVLDAFDIDILAAASETKIPFPSMGVATS